VAQNVEEHKDDPAEKRGAGGERRKDEGGGWKQEAGSEKDEGNKLPRILTLRGMKRMEVLPAYTPRYRCMTSCLASRAAGEPSYTITPLLIT
jgi:hypothetical protein